MSFLALQIKGQILLWGVLLKLSVEYNLTTSRLQTTLPRSLALNIRDWFKDFVSRSLIHTLLLVASRTCAVNRCFFGLCLGLPLSDIQYPISDKTAEKREKRVVSQELLPLWQTNCNRPEILLFAPGNQSSASTTQPWLIRGKSSVLNHQYYWLRKMNTEIKLQIQTWILQAIKTVFSSRFLWLF